MLEAIISIYALIACLLTFVEYIVFCFSDCYFIFPSNIDHIFGKVGSWIFCIGLGLLSPLFAIIKTVWWIYKRIRGDINEG